MQISRRNFLVKSGAVSSLAAFRPSLLLGADHAASTVSAEAAWRRLMEGNRRFVEGHATARNTPTRRGELTGSQSPIAAILSCSDSRVAPETVFDQGLGELFVVRIAGNFLDNDGLASLEYAVAHLGTSLIVVLGHENCGAVKAAIAVKQDNAVLEGHLPELVGQIVPAVETAMAQHPADLLAASILANVNANVQRIQNAGPVIAPRCKSGAIAVMGGIYKLADGHVDKV